MKTYTIKLGARIPAYGEVEIEAASADEALTAFLDKRIQDHYVEWEPDWGFSNDYVMVDEIVSEEEQEVHQDLYIQGDTDPEEALKRLAEVIAHEAADVGLENVLVLTPPSGRPSFTLKFERYAQEVAWVEVEADNLDQAMVEAKQIDARDLDWEIEDTDPTYPRLYGIKDEEQEWVATVDLKPLLGIPTWFSEDLRDEWTVDGSGSGRACRRLQGIETTSGGVMYIQWAGREDASEEKRARIDAEVQEQLLDFDSLDEKELLAFAMRLGPEMGNQLLEQQGVTLYRSSELEENYNNMLDEGYGIAQIAGQEYSTSDALKSVDPTAYRLGLNEYVGEFQEVRHLLGISSDDWQGENLMVRTEDWEYEVGQMDADDMREQIMDDNPELQAEIEAHNLSRAGKAAASWSTSAQHPENLLPKAVQAQVETHKQAQSRRL